MVMMNHRQGFVDLQQRRVLLSVVPQVVVPVLEHDKISRNAGGPTGERLGLNKEEEPSSFI